jgi:AraC-like DNA-binding protein/quercetin dioxygenase-like cupin family protein
MKAASPTPPAFFSAQVSEARRFYLDLNPPASHRLVVVCGGSEHCAPDYHMQRSDFRYYSTEFVARGEGVLRLAGQEHRLIPGTAFAYGPGIPHDIRCNPDRPLVKQFVDFVGRSVRSLLKSPAPEPGQVVQTSAPDQILHLFDDLAAAGLRHTPYASGICSALLEHLILRLAETAVSPGTIGTLAFETFQRCREFVEAHYLELHGLADLADRCRIDPAYLCRLFAKFHHQSPYQYLTLLKMRHAAHRLETPGVLVKQVANELHFSDAFQFSRTFKRMLGVSPRQFMQILPSRTKQHRGNG